jgi:hypothetical protein
MSPSGFSLWLAPLVLAFWCRSTCVLLLGAHVDSDDRLFRFVLSIRISLIVPPVEGEALLGPELHRFRLTPDPLRQSLLGAGSSPHLPRLMVLGSGSAILGLSVPGASVSL